MHMHMSHVHVMHSSHLEWSVGGQRALPRAPPTPLFSRCSRHLLVTMICSPGRTDTPRLTRDAGGVGVDFGLLADVCAGKRVLDLYCYSGGFSLNAAAAGAALCLGVDSSALAVSMAQRNAELNNLDGTCSYTRSEVAAFLKGEGEDVQVHACTFAPAHF